MALNVLYEGITLAEGVEVRPGEDGLFLPLAAPMPVGTRLHVERAGQGRQRVRVRRVVEGEASGVFISAEGAQLFPLVEAAALATSTSVSGPIPLQVPRPVEPELTVPTPPRAIEPEVTAPMAAAPVATPVVDEAGFEEGDLPGDRTIIMAVPPVVADAAAEEESESESDPGPEDPPGSTGEPTASSKASNGAARKGRGKGKRSGGKR